MKPILFFILILMTFSCDSKMEIEKRKDDSVVGVSGEDAKMNKIIEDARKSIDVFLTALSNSKPDEKSFTVKFPFKTDPDSKDKVEHIWLSDIKKIKDNQYSGVVGNDPFFIKKMKLGQTVEFDISQISDWMFFKGNKIVGGKSIKYLIENIPEKDRDEESKFMLQKFE